jgi:multidrug efflux pump subunit AcrB
MFSDVFVDRPRLAVVIAIVTTIAGGLALTKLPVSQFPDIVPPQVAVTASFPGASAAVVEATVAQPIEAQVNGVDQALYMKSNSGNDGSYTLTVSFALGTNPDIDTVNVNNRVQTALAKLPQTVQQGGVTVQKKSSAILEFLQFYSEGAKLTPLYVSNYVTINVLDAISRVQGVGQAQLIGALNYSMRIWMNTDRMLALGLVPSDIQSAIQSQNIQGAVGRIGSRPTDDNVSFQVNLQTKGRLTTPEEFGNIVLRANSDGSVLRIRDVARVELGAQNQDTDSRLNGNPAVTMAIYLAPGANAVDTSARVNAALDKLGERFPDSMKKIIFYDSSTFVSDRGDQNAGRGIRAGGRCGISVSGQFPRDHYSGHRRTGLADRNLRRAFVGRLFRQHGLLARPRARHRHRGR